jgi:phosphoglycolate phosphatase
VARFILFDVDGTLIDAAGAGRKALSKAMIEIAGISDGFRGVDFAGKTDTQIIKEGLRKLGLESRDNLLESLRNSYLFHLRAEVSRGKGQVKPGVRELLHMLQDRGDTFLGLLTGNLEQGARLKLGPFGLNSFFPVGAYGSDAEDRNLLLPIAVQRLRTTQGTSVGYGNCVVVGDTPRDVECARIYGARSIAVATGPYSLEKLKDTGADLVVPDLSDTAQIMECLQVFANPDVS